jgi:predicted aconitase
MGPTRSTADSTMSALNLTPAEQTMLDGADGSGTALAMRIVVRLAQAMDALSLIPVSGAHIDSCLYHGKSGLDFVHRLVDGAAHVRVPTTLNVSSLDLLHPELYVGDPAEATAARELMDGYVSLGCEPTWTCAPYQRQDRPARGADIAWAESNAIVFANSVLGARTHRYGDFVDIAAAITGRVPNAGLHVQRNRRATVIIDVSELPTALLEADVLYPCLGFVIGRRCSGQIPAIVGLTTSATEDDLKALGAAAASSGSLAMFHAVGLTPEAPSLSDACQGVAPSLTIKITADDIRDARDQLSSTAEQPLATVSVGTPHYSLAEIGRLYELLAGSMVASTVAFYVSTARETLHEAMLHGWITPLRDAGVIFVTDTCTYITPIIRDTKGLGMTDSAKWAYYAPGNIGVEAIFGSVSECVRSAIAGRVIRNDWTWSDAS